MQKNTIWYAAAGALVILSAVALFVSWRANHRPAALEPAAQTAPIPAPSGIANPVPVPSGLTAQPLPTLEASDEPLHESLADLFGAKSVDELFRPEMLVRHIVVSIDNLPRKHLAVELRPTKNLPGNFAVTGDEQAATIDPSNYQRYAPDVHGPVAMVRPNVMYQYADPKIEALSAGQKLLVRMGPDNEAIVKAKLRELRAAVAAHKAEDAH